MPISCSVTAALAATGLIYLGMLPFSVRSFRRLRREAEAPRDELDAIRRESA
jgi:CDP-diacylglycerol--serine O-phosphatidyltransferase